MYRLAEPERLTVTLGTSLDCPIPARLEQVGQKWHLCIRLHRFALTFKKGVLPAEVDH